MISLRRPNESQIETYRQQRLGSEPTHSSLLGADEGLRSDTYIRTIGTGSKAFGAARTGLTQWVAHRGAGVEIYPRNAQLVEGETVVLATQQLGLWVLAACRIESVVSESRSFGFTYATLPDHPERGFESFVVSQIGDRVDFEIRAVSVPATVLTRVGSPVSRKIQERITNGYIDAVERHVKNQ